MPLLVQSPSFLDYQKTMEKEGGKNNARSRFGIHLIPGANQTLEPFLILFPQKLLVRFIKRFTIICSKVIFNRANFSYIY